MTLVPAAGKSELVYFKYVKNVVVNVYKLFSLWFPVYNFPIASSKDYKPERFKYEDFSVRISYLAQASLPLVKRLK